MLTTTGIVIMTAYTVGMLYSVVYDKTRRPWHSCVGHRSEGAYYSTFESPYGERIEEYIGIRTTIYF